MWFLPMLFWCFLCGWVVLKITNKYIRYIIISGLFIVSIKQLPFQLNESFYYLIYFMMGYELYLFRENFIKRVTIKANVYSWILFIISFLVLTVAIENVKVSTESIHGLIKAISLVGVKMITFIYASIGLFSMFITSIYCTTRTKLPNIIIKIGSLCFGVYLFQQFILQILYFHTDIPNHVSSIILPMVGFAIALIASVTLSYLCRLTKLGRHFI